MVQIKTFIHGLYPRSEKLIHATRSLDRGRMTVTQVNTIRRQDQAQLIKLQKKLRFSFAEDGKLNWQDWFRPFTENSQGLEVGPLTRFFDNNTFFRQPQISGKITFNLNRLKSYFTVNAKLKHWKISLPSPFFLTHLSANRSSRSHAQVLSDLTAELKRLSLELISQGATAIQLNDPYVGYHGLSAKDFDHLNSSLKVFTQGLSVPVIYHVYFGSAAPIFKQLLKLPVTAIGIDMFKTPLESLSRGKVDKTLIFGCLNSRSSVIESPTSIAQFAVKAIKRFKLKEIWLQPNASLEFVTTDIAQAKLQSLASAAKKLA